MIRKVFLSFIPVNYLLALATGFLFWLFWGANPFSYLLFNLLLILVFIRIGIILHEAGHLVFAWIAGGTPRRMSLGKGHEILRIKLQNVQIILNKSLRAGFATAYFESEALLRLRYFFYILGGPGTNFLFAYLCYHFFGFNLQVLNGGDGLNMASSFILANGLLGVFSLVPYHVNHNGIKIPTDGLSLLRLPFQKIEKLNDEINREDIFLALEYMETKQYEKAVEIYKRYAEIEDTAFLSKLNLGIAYIHVGEMQKSYELHMECYEKLEQPIYKSYQVILNNNIAWLYLIRGEYEKANKHSEVAYSNGYRESYIRGTRGSSLIEVGKLDEGIDLLKANFDQDFVNSVTMNAGIYLCYAFYLKGNEKEKMKYESIVLKNQESLGIDTKLLWEKIVERMEDR